MTTKQKSNSLCTTSVPPIAWNDKAILGVCYNGKLSKSLRININFKIKSGCPKGMSLRYTPKTNKKVFLYRYSYNGQKDFMLFEFIPGVFGILQMEEKLINLKKQYYDPLGSYWKFNPKDNIQTEAEVLETQSKTVREVIQRLLQDNFPRKSKVGKLASVSQRQFSRILIGNHKRFKHLQFSDNDKGWGITELDGGLTWETFWSKYPPKNSDVSVYDNASLGPLLIDNLTKSVVKKFLNAKERTPGGKKNLIKALQCLWNYAINQDFFGDNVPQDPTKDINIVVDDESNLEAHQEFKRSGKMYYGLDEVTDYAKKICTPWPNGENTKQMELKNGTRPRVYLREPNWTLKDGSIPLSRATPQQLGELWELEPGHEDMHIEKVIANLPNYQDISFEPKQYETKCWACKQDIELTTETKCEECDYAIKCKCGKCACDKPGSKIKKKNHY